MDDEAILAGLDGEPEAFALFYRRHVAALLGYFLRRTHDPELAADLCAETFAAALDGAHRFDPARGPAIAWLYGIARRLLAHAERRCGSDDGEGLCLVDPASRFRCFTKSQVDGGGAVTRTPAGVIVGIVPDGVAAVTLTAGGKSATARSSRTCTSCDCGSPPGRTSASRRPTASRAAAASSPHSCLTASPCCADLSRRAMCCRAPRST